MAGDFGRVDRDELKRMQLRFEQIVGESKSGKVYEKALKECGRVHLANCVRNTPFGVYPREVSFVAWKGTPKEKIVSFNVTPKHGGTMKKGWVVRTQAQAEASKGVPSQAEIDGKVAATKVYKTGKDLRMTFFNHVTYAEYVDKGHRICRPAGNQIGWVKPQNFIRRSEEQTARVMPGIITRHMKDAIEEKLNDR